MTGSLHRFKLRGSVLEPWFRAFDPKSAPINRRMVLEKKQKAGSPDDLT